MLDIERVRADFPILSRTVRGVPLVYLDSGATSQKPFQVLDAERHFYENSNAAVHRGAHALAEEATDAYESARETIATFVGAESEEIVFTKNATEAINLVAYAFSNATDKARQGREVDQRFVIGPGDSIVVSEMEHHANLIPWQELCAKTGASLRWFAVTDEGRLNIEPGVIDSTTKCVSIVHQSNLLGTINPVREIMEMAHAVGALGMVDLCQSVPHMPVNVADLGADFAAWSGHKMLGPTGIGILWGKSDLLNAMPPFLTGGSMIEMVNMDHSTFSPAPKRFEAGVPMVAQAVGLARACEYLRDLGMENVYEHERELTAYTLAELAKLEGVRVIGPTDMAERGSAVSFVVDGIHPHDVGHLMDSKGVAVRVGHHCCWPTCRRFDIPATTRISTYLYNDQSDIDQAILGIKAAQEFFGATPRVSA
ncbi:MAG: cysteine desulfurase [Actinomycetales bacterium]|nr:cysteine desulfurase [Actinomycetales bacterium]